MQYTLLSWKLKDENIDWKKAGNISAANASEIELETLTYAMDSFIESKQYLDHMPNGIMLSQHENTALFLDTETGEKICFGFFTARVKTIHIA